ncbi:MAG: hypothetical protein Q9Q40_03005 [Acidobacteriota bacterium]|nr:hypothetical protein [Acidobacteriota bacterium]
MTFPADRKLLEGREDSLRAAALRVAGEAPCQLPWDRHTLLWLHGTTMIEARCTAAGEIALRAFLVIGPVLQRGLEAELARLSSGLDVGRLECDEDGDVALTHTLGPALDENGLHDELQAFCCVADGLDDLLCRRFGGYRSVDHFERTVASILGASFPDDPPN